MLDVHAPHAPMHTWKDFFLHIATIVTGLLIAVGLEQTVEYIHHQRELTETRKALDNEIETNGYRMADITAEFRRFAPILQTNLGILRFLQKHPGAVMSQCPGEYRLTTYINNLSDSNWKTARQNNTVSLMSDDESRRYADIYIRFDELDQLETKRTTALDDLRAITMEDVDPSHLSPAQLDHAVEAVRTSLVVESQIARSLGNFGRVHPEFDFSAPTAEERLQIIPQLKTPHYDSDKATVKAILDRQYGTASSPKQPTKINHK